MGWKSNPPYLAIRGSPNNRRVSVRSPSIPRKATTTTASPRVMQVASNGQRESSIRSTCTTEPARRADSPGASASCWSTTSPGADVARAQASNALPSNTTRTAVLIRAWIFVKRCSGSRTIGDAHVRALGTSTAIRRCRRCMYNTKPRSIAFRHTPGQSCHGAIMTGYLVFSRRSVCRMRRQIRNLSD